MGDDSLIATDVGLSYMINREPVAYLAADDGVTDGKGVPCIWHYSLDGQTPLIDVLGERPDGTACADDGSGDDPDDGGSA